MQELGVQEFPSMPIEHKGEFQKIDVGVFIREAQAFTDYLKEILSQISEQEKHSTVEREDLGFYPRY